MHIALHSEVERRHQVGKPVDIAMKNLVAWLQLGQRSLRHMARHGGHKTNLKHVGPKSWCLVTLRGWIHLETADPLAHGSMR